MDYNGNYTFVGGEANVNLTVSQFEKDFYCDKIVLFDFHDGLIANLDVISIKDGTVSRLVLHEITVLATASGGPIINLDFKTPIKFSKGNNVVISYSRNRDAGDVIAWNFYGWLE